MGEGGERMKMEGGGGKLREGGSLISKLCSSQSLN